MKTPIKCHAAEHDFRYEQAVNEHEDREAIASIPDSWITDAPEPVEPPQLKRIEVYHLMADALICAEYALTHPESNQQFALNVVRDAISAASNLNT